MNRKEEIKNICNELKEIVKELNVTILVTFYLSSISSSIIEQGRLLQEFDEKIILKELKS